MKVFLLLFVLLIPARLPPTYTCASAFKHWHTDVREAEIAITSWDGCMLTGTIYGITVQLWADGLNCPLHNQVPGVFQIRFDTTCGQVLDLSSSALPLYCPPRRKGKKPR